MKLPIPNTFGFLMAAICLTLTACPSPTSHQTEIPTALLATVERRDVSETIRLSGEIAPAYQVEIKPEVGGKLREVLATTGQQVKQGDLLFVIDDSDLQIEKASAQVDISGATVTLEKLAGNLQRARELFAAKLISKEVFDNLDADHRLAETALERARRRLETVEDRIGKTRVLAPADGTILTIPVIQGQVVVAAASVNSGTTVATLADLSSLLVNAHVNQLDIEKIGLGNSVEIYTGSEQEARTTGRITFIAPLASTKNNVKGFSVTATLEGDTSRFRPGMTVGVDLPLAHADNAVTVPVTAVFPQPEGGKAVYRQLTDGQIEKRPVEVGATDLFFAEILSGLDPGDRVLLTEPDKLPTGDTKS
jgi:RND family efflux transporter MFP subunit